MKSLLLEKTLVLGKRGRREVGAIPGSVGLSLSKLGEIVKDREAWCAVVRVVAKRVRHDLVAG